ncbi:MAG: integrase family protein [Methylomonas sp.]|nr:integrase family protein [Methylomonas sp.]
MSDKTIRLNKTTIDKLPIPEKDYILYWDNKDAGFGLRITSTGVKSFIIQKRVNGRDTRMTIGRYGQLTAEQARKEAEKLGGDIAKGIDPLAEKRLAKLEQKKVQEVFEDYLLTRKDLKPRTIRDMKEAFNEVIPDWLTLPMVKITSPMVEKRHRKHGETRSKARANLGMRYLQVLFNYAMAQYQDADGNSLISSNPVKRLSDVHGWYKIDRRKTVIKKIDLGSWVNAVESLPNESMRDFFMFVLLTGCRKEEAKKIRWDNIDFQERTLTFIDPKNSKDHTLPFSDYLETMLARRKQKMSSEFVFSDEQGRVVSNFRYAQAAVENVCGVKFCLHDLRRTFASLAESLDLSAYAVKRLLNHADGNDVTAGYLVLDVERLRAPMQQITDFVLKAAGLKQAAEVIQIKQARG